MADSVDGETGGERAQKARYRKPKCEQAEIPRTVLRLPEGAGGMAHTDVKEHESRADERAHQKQHGELRHRACQEQARDDHCRCGNERRADADAIDDTPRVHGKHHGQDREQGNERADGKRGGALMDREQRQGDTGTRKGEVHEDRHYDDQIKASQHG